MSTDSDLARRRRQIFKRTYQHIYHWQALREDRGMDDVITTPDGEDIYLGDLLVGLDTLPPRQREAFELICLGGYTESAARDKLLPNSKSSTPVQQYADRALKRMMAAYDARQCGEAQPTARKKKASHDIPVEVVEETTLPVEEEETHYMVTSPVLRDHLKQLRADLDAKYIALHAELADVQEALDQLNAITTVKPRVEDVAKEVIAAHG